MSALAKDTAAGDIRRARPLPPRAKPVAPRAAGTFQLRLIAEEELDAAVLEREFPTIRVERGAPGSGDTITIDDFAWRGSFDVGRFDEVIERADPLVSIAIRGDDAIGVACEVLARYQRCLPRRNQASSSALFDAVLDTHARLYGAPDPLAKADHDHALDAWQWVVRLEPNAGIAAQLAALFHDFDRLAGEPHERIEHRARDREATASGVGDRVYELLVGTGVAASDAARTRELVGRQHVSPGDPDVLLVDDADALSFLSLQSCRYADHFGLAQTRRKVAFTVGRLRPIARDKLRLIRLRPDVDRLVREVAGQGAP